MSSEPGCRVIFAPDLLLGALYDPAARAVLNAWRDGRIVPVLNRTLLVLYLRQWKEAGLPESLIKDWGVWLTSPDKSCYVQGESTFQEGLLACEKVALANGVMTVISLSTKQSNDPGVRWITAQEWSSRQR